MNLLLNSFNIASEVITPQLRVAVTNAAELYQKQPNEGSFIRPDDPVYEVDR